VLDIKNINVYIGGSLIIRNVSLTVKRGEVVSLIGRNGAGKTTLLKTIMGLLKPASGEIKFSGEDITHLSSSKIAKLGIGYAPDDLRIFPSLTVEENIELPMLVKGKSKKDMKDKLEFIYSVFPKLLKYRNRLGTQISGGERRMLAVARALAADPIMLLLDEPFEGLAPIIRLELTKSIHELLNRGLTFLITESNIRHVPNFINTLSVIERGEIIYSGGLEEAPDNDQVRQIFGLV